MFSTIMKILPSALDLIQYIVGLDDEEFESISSAWPAPIKLKMARVRAELEAQEHFFGG